MITSYQFARKLAADFRRGAITTVDQPADALAGAPPYYRLFGRLDIGAALATVEIHVPQDFSVVRRVPPRVWCHESWMRDGADWHNNPRTGMCWVLEALWRHAMNWEEKSALAVINEGRQWLLASVRNLVSRHYTAELEGLTAWPEEWSFWAHFDEGIKEYEREEQCRRDRQPI